MEVRNLITLDRAQMIGTYFSRSRLSTSRSLVNYSSRDARIGNPSTHSNSTISFFSQTPMPLARNITSLTRDHSLISKPVAPNLKGEVLKAAGLDSTDIGVRGFNREISGSLPEIDRRGLHSEPFSLVATNEPKLHLRIDGSTAEPRILVLDSHSLMILCLLDVIGIMGYLTHRRRADIDRAMGLSSFMRELLASHSVIFNTAKSKADVLPPHKNQYSEGIDLDIIRDFEISSTDLPLQLTDFPIFSARLRYIHQRMVDWRPIRFRQLWQRPYGDPIPYFAFWFGVFVGIVTFFTLILTAVQLGVTVRKS
jgi:hypothetical protein